MAFEKERLFISKSKRATLELFAQGIGLEQHTGLTLLQLRAQATLDRLALAEAMLTSAQRAARARPPDWRDAISRAYYSLYHTFRAVVFYDFGGDDHEEHRELPKHVPSDFPNHADWANKLKTARLDRNKVDYEPHPRPPETLRELARQMILDATALLPVARQYLQTKGLQ